MRVVNVDDTLGGPEEQPEVASYQKQARQQALAGEVMYVVIDVSPAAGSVD